MGNTYQICKACEKIYKEGICRVCGQPLGFNAIEGKCLLCTQTDYAEDRRKQEEVNNGVDLESHMIYSSSSEFTDEDYEKWMTFGQGNFTVERRLRLRKKWVLNKLTGVNGWTAELIEQNYPDIEKILDRNFSKLLGKKYILIHMGVCNIKFVTCVDREGLIVLINTKQSEEH